MAKMLWIVLFVLVACTKESKKTKIVYNPPQTPTPVQTPTEPRVITPQAPQTPPQEQPTRIPSDINQRDLVTVPGLLPTMYYVAQEKNTKCAGVYRRVNYNGSERTNLRTATGQVIATVCTRFAKVLDMEGTAILSDRGQGEVTVNYSQRIGNEHRYAIMNRCIYGQGVRPGLCLLPYYTLATDNAVNKVGDIFYVPAADGLRLPDGSLHEGYFIVRDTGSAFNNIGPSRVDMFVGLEPDNNNVFQRAGFHHRRSLPAFKVTGESAETVRGKLKHLFGDLY